MITKEVIEEIYHKYNKKPKNIEYLDLALLFEKAGIEHDILIDPETKELSIESIPEDSPFHIIPLSNIHAFVPFEEWVAIVMHSSIIFLNSKKPLTTIHIKSPQRSFWQRISGGHFG